MYAPPYYSSMQQDESPKNSEKFISSICFIILFVTLFYACLVRFSITLPKDEEINIESQYDIGISSLGGTSDIYIYASSESQYPIKIQVWITGEYLNDGLFHNAGDQFTKLKTFNLQPGGLEVKHEQFTDKYIYTNKIILKEEHIYMNPVDISWLFIILAFTISMMNFLLTIEGTFKSISDILLYIPQEIILCIIYMYAVMWLMRFVCNAELTFFIFNLRIF